jgi:hypothetical protein
MPSGPGALYGFSFWSCRIIDSLLNVLICPAFSHCGGYVVLAAVGSECGLGGKKLLAKIWLFSSFVFAIRSVFPILYLSAGILVLASVGGWCCK